MRKLKRSGSDHLAFSQESWAMGEGGKKLCGGGCKYLSCSCGQVLVSIQNGD